MNATITIERTTAKKEKLRKLIDISSPSRSIDIDEFLGDDDEFRIADAGVFKHFAQVTEHESIDDLLELWNMIRVNPYGAYFIYDYLLKNPHVLKVDERNRVSPLMVANRIGNYNYGFFKSRCDAGVNLFGGYIKRPQGRAAKEALEKCIDLDRFMSLAVTDGGYGMAEFRNGECITHTIPSEVLKLILEWRGNPDTKRNWYPSSSPVWGSDFVYVWLPLIKTDFYF
jgi:hypothetical protein